MMEMDDLDRVKCQIVKGRDINGIIKMLIMRQKSNSAFFFKMRRPKREGLENQQWLLVLGFNERRCTFSLGFWPIEP